MKITQIRNATLKVECGGMCCLIDPWLQDVGSITSFVEPGMLKNPTVPLPMPIDEVLSGVDCYIITHVHPDHLDLEFESFENMAFAAHVLNKAVTVIVQGEEDVAFMREAGFKSVIRLDDKLNFDGMELVRTPTHHGTEGRPEPAMGLVMMVPGEPVLYIAGDTVYFQGVEKVLDCFSPNIIVLNAGGATIGGNRLIMDECDVLKVHEEAPDAIIIASHLDAVDHASVTRASLRAFAEEQGIGDRLLIPEDGESIKL